MFDTGDDVDGLRRPSPGRLLKGRFLLSKIW